MVSSDVISSNRFKWTFVRGGSCDIKVGNTSYSSRDKALCRLCCFTKLANE